MAFQAKINGVESVSELLKRPVREIFVLCLVLHILSEVDGGKAILGVV